MKWSKESNPKEGVSHYNHTILETPIGEFIIEWKGWKEDPSYTIMLEGGYVTDVWDLLEAKKTVESFMYTKLELLKRFLKCANK